MPEVSMRANSYRDDPAVPTFDDSRPLFVFDGVCVLCSGGASWLMRHDKRALVNFTPAQETLGQALYTHYGVEMNESYLLVANGRAFTASRGYLELCRTLGGRWHILRVATIIPEGLRDRLYALIARNRYRWFGKADYCALLTPAQRSRLL
jgi:predicted DCC family thiol-disulfide oxidoreductase YuxK